MEHFLNWQSTVCLPTRQSRIISTTFTAQCCSALSLKPTASSSCPAFCGNLQKEAKHHSSKKQKERIKHIYLLSHHPQPACKGRDTKFSICLLLLFFSNHKPSLLAAVVCFFPLSLLSKELCTELAWFVSLNLIEGICRGCYWISVLLSHLFPPRF